MSALERVARRIGMTYQPATDGTRAYWYDEGDCDSEAWVNPDDLRAYLLTQALRVQVEYRMETGPADNRWWAADPRVDHDGLPLYSEEAATPAAAIIALAERIEGESNE